MSFKEDFRTLDRIANAFDHMRGGVPNRRRQKVHKICDTLHEWRKEYGLKELERHAREYEKEHRAGDE